MKGVVRHEKNFISFTWRDNGYKLYERLRNFSKCQKGSGKCSSNKCGNCTGYQPAKGQLVKVCRSKGIPALLQHKREKMEKAYHYHEEKLYPQKIGRKHKVLL